MANAPIRPNLPSNSKLPERKKVEQVTTATVTKKKSVQVPVVVSYPDGSQRIKNVEADAPALQTVTPTPQDAPSGASSGYNWVPIVLGLLAAIGGVGYAAFVNQDHIRRMLSQFGIRI